jgi:hypothetical protein
MKNQEYYFLAAGFAAFFGAAALGAAFAFGLTGAGATGTTLSAVRRSRRALISALILSLRSVSFAMLALSFATALAVFETGAFLQLPWRRVSPLLPEPLLFLELL